MKIVLYAALAASLGAVALTAATPASARVVCNSNGDCWHTDRHDNFGPKVRFEQHSDDWYFHQHWDQNANRHWREVHDGRGYYDHGVWVAR